MSKKVIPRVPEDLVNQIETIESCQIWISRLEGYNDFLEAKIYKAREEKRGNEAILKYTLYPTLKKLQQSGEK